LWPRIHARQTGAALLLFDYLKPHIRHEGRGSLYRAVGLLEVLQDGDDAAADGYGRADNQNPSGLCYLISTMYPESITLFIIGDAMEKNLEDIVHAIVRLDPPKKIILFGSRARGDADSESDVDLALLYDGLDRNPFDIAQALRMQLLGITTLPLDLLVFDFNDFEQRSRHNSNVENIILNEGQLAYG